jgi:hypothetical protein
MNRRRSIERTGKGRVAGASPSSSTSTSSSPFLTQRPGAPQEHLQGLGPGRPLDPDTRTRLEPHLAQSLEGVRIHTGPQAEEQARAVEARAFTVGRDVVFGAGHYQPGTREGLALLAHEVTHVAQQAATGAPALQRAPKEPAQFESPTTRKAGGGDLAKAVLELPEVKKAIADFVKQFQTMPRGEKAAVVGGFAAVGAGALAGIASNPEARKEMFGLLHGLEIPSVPYAPMVAVQFLTKDAPPKFDPLNPPKPESSTPTGIGFMLKLKFTY